MPDRDSAKPVLPTDAAARNDYPLADGLFYYFSSALAEVARVSKIGNDQHNPGQPMHWARGKSTDHANKILKHQLDAGLIDSDGTRHSAKVAWRALAQLQEELEREEGAPLPRNARPAAESSAAPHGVISAPPLQLPLVDGKWIARLRQALASQTAPE